MALRVANVSHDFIRKLSQEYLLDFMTMEKLATNYGTSPGTISNILYKGVTEKIVDNFTAEAIANKAITFTENTHKTAVRWRRAIELREAEDIEVDILHVKASLEEVNFQIDSYDDYAFADDCAPSKKYLKCQKSQLIYKLEKLEERLKKLKG